jgi:acetyltransferase-like isoleucine patch superfamily enzyme
MQNEDVEVIKEVITKIDIPEKENIEDFELDFITSSAISRINVKFLIFYIPIFWFSGMITLNFWIYPSMNNINWITEIILFPLKLLGSIYLFIISCTLFTKLFLIFINLIHYPKEGIFRAEEGDYDYEFWRLRIELKKLVVWLCNNSPLPWIDTLAFRWFGTHIDFSSHLLDAWVDVEFIKFGRKITIGQGAVVMSSMVVGNYLIIKEVEFEDYAVIGGVSTIAPGTKVGEDSVVGAFSTTSIKQNLEPGWIYFGIPVIKLKENKYAEIRQNIIAKRDVDKEEKYYVETEINIDEDKKEIAE